MSGGISTRPASDQPARPWLGYLYPGDYADAKRGRMAHFVLDGDKPGAGRLAERLGLKKGEAYFGVRASRSFSLDTDREGPPVEVRKGALLMFRVEAELHSNPRRGGFIGVVSAASQRGGLARGTVAGERIVGLDEDIKTQFEALLKHRVRVGLSIEGFPLGTEGHLADLAVVAPYAKAAINKALQSPLRVRIANVVGFGPKVASQGGEER